MKELSKRPGTEQGLFYFSIVGLLLWGTIIFLAIFFRTSAPICISNVAQTSFQHVYASGLESFAQLLFQVLVYRFATGYQRNALIVDMDFVVGVVVGQLNEGGVTLKRNVAVVVVHVKGGPEGVFNLPLEH